VPIARFSLFGPDDGDLNVLVESDTTASAGFSLIYRLETPAGTHEYTIALDTSSGSLAISGLSDAASKYLACLGACGLGHLVQELLECWNAGHRTPAALLKCLNAKRTGLSGGLVNCAIACLAA
jgi:hypothetical protein